MCKTPISRRAILATAASATTVALPAAAGAGCVLPPKRPQQCIDADDWGAYAVFTVDNLVPAYVSIDVDPKRAIGRAQAFASAYNRINDQRVARIVRLTLGPVEIVDEPIQ